MSPKRGLSGSGSTDEKSLAWDSQNLGVVSGRGYPSYIWGGTGTWYTTQTAFRGFVAHRTFVVDALSTEVTSAGGGGSLGRLGFYGSDQNGLPSNLIEDLGTFAGDSTGFKTLTFTNPRLFRMGEVYWFALQVDDATITFRQQNDYNRIGRPVSGASSYYMFRDDTSAGYADGLPNPTNPTILAQAVQLIIARAQ